jgi:hypothetical protein
MTSKPSVSRLHSPSATASEVARVKPRAALRDGGPSWRARETRHDLGSYPNHPRRLRVDAVPNARERPPPALLLLLRFPAVSK